MLLTGLRNWYAFWEEGADVLIAKESTLNDDFADHVYLEPIGGFTTTYEYIEPN